MVKAKYHQGVRVCENRFINRHLKSRLINALEYGDRMSANLSHTLLEIEGRYVEQLQRPGDSLKKFRCSPLRPLVIWPGYPTDFCHRREAVVQFRGITLRFPGIAPRPVNAHPPFAWCVFSRQMDLIVCSCSSFSSSAHNCLSFVLICFKSIGAVSLRTAK